MMDTRIVAVVVIAALGVGLGGGYLFGFNTGLTAEDPPLDGSLDAILAAGKIVYGGSFDYPPWEFYNATNHETGFAPELARLLAQRLGVRYDTTIVVEWLPAAWDICTANLETYKVDMLGGLTILEEYEATMDMSISIAETWQMFIAQDGAGVNLTSWEDLANYIPIGTQAGASTYSYFLETLVDTGLILESDIVTYPNEVLLLEDLEAGRINVAEVSQAMWHSAADDYPALELVWWAKLPTQLGYGMAFGNLRGNLAHVMNWIIWEMQRDGTIDELIAEFDLPIGEPVP